MLKSRNIIATPPGATIKEQLEDRGLSQKEFAFRMNLSEKHICNLLHGKVHLTSEVAERLETVLGVPADFWNRLEAIYQEKLEKAKAENDMEEEIKLAKKFPYAEMIKYGWVCPASNQEDKVRQLRSYFEVVRLSLIFDRKITKIVCRKLSKTEKSDYALLAWAQQAKIKAREIKTAPIQLNKLSAAIPEIRSMTTMPPEKFCPMLKQKLSNCGIALVFLPHIEGSFLHGASFRDGKKIVVGLTVRGKDADKFWFSLFHELGHILYGHLDNNGEVSEQEEKQADEFSKNTLISEKSFAAFVSKHIFSENKILEFSKHEKIAPGIVVGRLQKEKYIPYQLHNHLKEKYQLKTQ